MRYGKAGATLEQLQRLCRKYDLKVTPQRIAIYEMLLKSKEHPSAEQLHNEIKTQFPKISLDTVNRTLITYSRIGLISLVEGSGIARRYDADMRNHHHAHCINCGKIIDFYDKTLDSIKVPMEIEKKFKILNKRVVISGLCRICQME